MIPLIFVLAVIALVAGGEQTTPYDEGRAANAGGDHSAAAAAIKGLLTQQGEVNAQLEIARMYRDGIGVAKDVAKAAR